MGGSFEIPAPRATADVPLAGGARVTLRRHGNPDGLRILLSHGNGLASDLYCPFWMQFLEDFDLVVFDLRNHGWNEPSDRTYHNPRAFAEDLDAIVSGMGRVFGAKSCVGIFHSISALVSLLLPSRGSGFAGLILFDPPLCKPGMSQLEFDKHMEQCLHMLRGRQSRFRTEAEFSALMAFSPFVSTLDPRARDLLVRTTLRRSPDGSGYELRCPPDHEVQLAEFVTAYAVLADMDDMRCPVKVIGADPTLPLTYLPSFDPKIVTDVDYDFIPEVGHFVPLEAPEESFALSVAFMERQGLVKRAQGRLIAGR